MKAGDFKLAKKSFDHVLSVASPSVQLLYLAGLSRVNLSDWKGTRKFLERAMKIYPAMTVAQQHLGVTYAKLADKPTAQSMLATLKASGGRCTIRVSMPI
jgi:tetratricopeptide (TPR) repeat protein